MVQLQRQRIIYTRRPRGPLLGARFELNEQAGGSREYTNIHIRLGG